MTRLPPRAALAAPLPILAPAAAFAAEGGAGFCLLGTRAIDAGVVPPPGTYVRTAFCGFTGKADARAPDSGAVQVGLQADVALGLFTGLWVPEGATLLGGRPYRLVTVPVGWKRIDVSATLTGPGGTRTERRTRLERHAPRRSGGGRRHRLGVGPLVRLREPARQHPRRGLQRRPGRQHRLRRWAADMSLATTWRGPDGWQADFAAGLTVNGENPATAYRTGNELHVEAAAAKAIGGWTLGLAGCSYAQATGDSGAGAVLGDFKGRVAAIGPAVTWAGAWGAQPVSLDARWLHEFDARNRVEGDAFFLNLAFPLGAGSEG